MEGSEFEQVKLVKRGTEESQGRRKRVDKKKKHGASRLQKGTDVSEGDMAGGSDRHQVKRKRVKEWSSAWIDEYGKKLALRHAKRALEFYEKSQDDAEFEILEVLNRSNSRLQHPEHPEYKSSNLWSHISFIAKLKKADCNVSPTHFFCEFFRDVDARETTVTYCSTFQPSDDPGFNHVCIFCPRGLKFHPSDGYCVGRPPWRRRSRHNVGYVQPPWVNRKA
ncbi:hypothetical protein DCAR_0727415 [Daucus carota subsp. sativus]|uniref:DUF3615 domain-containing protein n=1 Tax=Daucus carota subsp. sativus TaxID=79200 RepID=A0A161ZIN1_DAUCS|nr:PREDICTED: uncharacterized protein LOC108194496 isoform X2 [Daucus carota subsp. sativus]WOH07980.1 hypothetical protein DCAR_0727415 [Daucus carota subsp. sativus]